MRFRFISPDILPLGQQAQENQPSDLTHGTSAASISELEYSSQKPTRTEARTPPSSHFSISIEHSPIMTYPWIRSDNKLPSKTAPGTPACRWKTWKQPCSHLRVKRLEIARANETARGHGRLDLDAFQEKGNSGYTYPCLVRGGSQHRTSRSWVPPLSCLRRILGQGQRSIRMRLCPEEKRAN